MKNTTTPEATMTTQTTQEHVRMNDYVGAGIYATLIWKTKCTSEHGHTIQLLSHTCSRCNAKPTIKWEAR